jgi:hypothetical protein
MWAFSRTYHFYDTATGNGEPTLGLRSLVYGTDGWPRFGWDLKDGIYSLTSALMTGSADANMALGLDAGTPSAPTFQAWGGGNGQLWNIQRLSPNTYRISNVQNGLGLSMSGGNVVLAPCQQHQLPLDAQAGQ